MRDDLYLYRTCVSVAVFVTECVVLLKHASQLGRLWICRMKLTRSVLRVPSPAFYSLSRCGSVVCKIEFKARVFAMQLTG